MKVYITKYALTRGIQEVEVEEPTDIAPNMVVLQGKPYRQCFHKWEWFESREMAVARAEELRGKRITSLQKQIAKLVDMSFA